LNFSKEQDSSIKLIIASSLHEPFLLTHKDEDTSKLREAFKILLEENEKEIIAALSTHMDIILSKYCNDHCTKNFNFNASKSESSTPSNQAGLSLPKSSKESDFTSIFSTRNSKEEKKGHKKISAILFEASKDEENSNNMNNSPLLPEYINELIFSDLLGRLLVYDTNLFNNHGLWRDQSKYLHNLSQTLHHFNAIEFHESFIPSLLDYIRGGN
jgi:hypothetical protein